MTIKESLAFLASKKIAPDCVKYEGDGFYLGVGYIGSIDHPNTYFHNGKDGQSMDHNGQLCQVVYIDSGVRYVYTMTIEFSKDGDCLKKVFDEVYMKGQKAQDNANKEMINRLLKKRETTTEEQKPSIHAHLGKLRGESTTPNSRR